MIGSRVAVALVSLIGIAGCGDAPRAQVIVTLDAEPGVRSEARSLLVTVRGGAGPGSLEEIARFEEKTPGEDRGALVWPRVFALVPENGDASRFFELHAEARDLGEHLVGETRLLRGYAEGQVVHVRLVLDDRCRGIQCREDERCENGVCRPADEPTGFDAGVPSADAGPASSCMTALECDDGLFCNGPEQCTAGTCTLGTRVTCDDGVACTDDLCTDTGCQYLPNPSLCTLGDAPVCNPTTGCQYETCDAITCTADRLACLAAECAGSACVRSPTCALGQQCCAGECVNPGCEDGNPCTTNTCGPSGCVTEPFLGPCDDFDPCTNNDMCVEGSCRGQPPACDDGNPCTADTCDGRGGCAHPPAGGVCDDGDPCTTGDACTGGSCRGAPVSCADGVACTDDSCNAGSCVHAENDAWCTAGTAGMCDAMGGCQYGPTCTAASCVAGPCETAMCVGDSCLRVSTCAMGDVCCAGSCVRPGCNDFNPCTNDSCGAGGCTHVANTVACDDGNPCTTADRCASRVCSGTPMVCADTNPCTADSCMGGICRFNPVPDGAACNDGLVCTIDDRCNGGACGGFFDDCDDGRTCTDDSCVEGVGCRHMLVRCGPGSFCSEDYGCSGGF